MDEIPITTAQWAREAIAQTIGNIARGELGECFECQEPVLYHCVDNVITIAPTGTARLTPLRHCA